MKINNTIYIFILLLLSCSPDYKLASYENKVVTVQAIKDSSAMMMIKPYQNAIEKKMNQHITFSKTQLNKKGFPSKLGNFITDLCLSYSDAHMCIMNNGGLRTFIDSGNIITRNIYELMPFENELVIVNLNKDDYVKLINYIAKKGEPFSGITITINKERELLSHSWPVNFEYDDKIKVLTSDYLANGGDQMSFFQNKKQEKIGIKVRDAIIDYCNNIDTIDVILDKRVIIK